MFGSRRQRTHPPQPPAPDPVDTDPDIAAAVDERNQMLASFGVQGYRLCRGTAATIRSETEQLRAMVAGLPTEEPEPH